MRNAKLCEMHKFESRWVSIYISISHFEFRISNFAFPISHFLTIHPEQIRLDQR
jgi:hypothetical protein